MNYIKRNRFGNLISSLRKRIKKPRNRQQLVLYGLYATTAAVVLVFILSVVLFAWYAKELPEPGKIKRDKGFSTTFTDRDDKVIYDIFEDENRIPVQYKTLPDYVKQATVAIEDKSFYKHEGFSIFGMVRAAFNTVFRGRLEGGSTLTQQLVKNVLLSPERTFTRKIKEFVLSTEIERRFSKDEILEMYLNEAPYGGTFWGIESASKGYFGKEASDLTLVEAAILAGFPQRPSKYSPFVGEKNLFKSRTKDVLRRMREDKYITPDQEKKALSQLEKIKFSKPKTSILAPHFVFYVRDYIAEELDGDILDQGITIKTTLDSTIQKEVEKIVSEEIKKIRSYNATNASVVVIDNKTSQILAMVGSYDYNDEDFGKFNTATALRQPGSALKPITYAVALEQGYTASTMLMDVKTTFPNQGTKDYSPVNYDGKYRGPMQLRFALGNSINVVAVKLLAMVGVRDFLTKAYDMGLTTFAPNDKNINRFGLAVTLGGGETKLVDLTSAYSVFARGGIAQPYSSVIRVSDNSGKKIFDQDKPDQRKVMDKEIAFIISHILSDNVARTAAFGSRSYLNIPGKTVAVKTGTTNDIRDNWCVGYTNDITVGVWVGNNDNSPMNRQIVSGTTGAAPIWNRVMQYLLNNGYDDGIIDKPKDVEALQIDAFLGGLVNEGYPKRSEYFLKGTAPADISPFYKKVKVSKNEPDKLANDLEIKLGEYDERDCIVIEESDPVSSDGQNRWQEAIDAWSNEQSDDKYKCPKETSTTKQDDIVVRILEPSDKSKKDSNDVKIRAKITSLDPISKVEIKANGSVVKSFGSGTNEVDETINLSDGTYDITVYAQNSAGKSSESNVKIGVKREWDYKDQPKPTDPPAPTTTSAPTPTVSAPTAYPEPTEEESE